MQPQTKYGEPHLHFRSIVNLKCPSKWLSLYQLWDLGEATHTFVLCWMPKPLPPRNQCTGWFALAKLWSSEPSSIIDRTISVVLHTMVFRLHSHNRIVCEPYSILLQHKYVCSLLHTLPLLAFNALIQSHLSLTIVLFFPIPYISCMHVQLSLVEDLIMFLTWLTFLALMSVSQFHAFSQCHTFTFSFQHSINTHNFFCHFALYHNYCTSVHKHLHLKQMSTFHDNTHCLIK